MITCKNCLLPETHETITFNQNSVCNIWDSDADPSIETAPRIAVLAENCACACTDLDACMVTRKIKDCGEFWDQAPVFSPVLRPQCGLKTGTTRALQTE